MVTEIINECSDKLPETTFMGNFKERVTKSTIVSGGPGQIAIITIINIIIYNIFEEAWQS